LPDKVFLEERISSKDIQNLFVKFYPLQSYQAAFLIGVFMGDGAGGLKKHAAGVDSVI
jgi:hypothetical protein